MRARRRRGAGIVAAHVMVGLVLAGPVTGCAPTGSGEGAAAPATPVPAVTPTPAPPRTATVVLGGDLLWHNTTWLSARDDARRGGDAGPDDHDFTPMFGSMASVIADADLAVCNQEVPLAPDGGPYHNYPSFAAPPEVAAGVAEAGYDVCTLASNHALDQGVAGIERTVAAFREAGVATTGAYATEQDAAAPTIATTEDGVRIAVVNATYGLNGYQLPADRDWAVDLIDTEDMVDRGRQAREAGADIVLAAVHDGAEYVTAPTDQQVAHATTLVGSGVFDLVYGHHAHTVQPWERIDGTWVVYGLGNQIAQQSPDRPATYEGITARFTFRETDDGFTVDAAEAIPTLATRYGGAGSPIRLVHVTAALEGTAAMPAGVTEQRLATARDRTLAAVLSRDAEDVRVG